MLDRARQAQGLSDFGAESFREGLDILVDSLDREARLNETGKAAVDGQIVQMLGARLQIEDWYRRHPEIDEQEIIAPLIGLGLPRTGSSALACMLGADPAVRSMRNWESMQPYPPPEPATYETDPRIKLAEQGMVFQRAHFPRAAAMLPSTAVSPTECQVQMGYNFTSQIFQAYAHIPTYIEWLNHKADLVPCYVYVKRVLKLLQWRFPKLPWRLKNPSHSLFITALDQVFPDARFVMTHRDITKVIPSVADLYSEFHNAFSDHVDLKWLGEMTSGFCDLKMRRMIAFRDTPRARGRFFDIYFNEFQEDPFPAIARLYAFLGEEFTPQAKAAMVAWRDGNPLAEKKYERTDPAAFGLDLDALRKRFRFYSDRFGLDAA